MAAEPNLDLAAQWGEHLVSLPEREREQAIAASRQAGMLAMPEEELAKIGQPPVRTLGEFLDTEIEIPPILVEPGIIARGGLTVMTSRGGKGKTTLSFNRLLRWAAGRPLFDALPEVMAPSQPLRSLIIENEGAGWHTQDILQTMAAGLLSPEEREQARENVHIWGDGGWSNMKLDNTDNIELVKRAVDSAEVDLLFLEPFRTLWRGEENSSTEMLKVIDAFHEIANTHDCAIVITHHEVKGSLEPGQDPMDAARGSGVLSDLGAVMERFVPVAGGKAREWDIHKARWRPGPAAVRMEYEHEVRGYRLIRENENQRRVEEVLRAAGHAVELSVRDLAEELQETQATARRWADAAVEDGRLKKRMAQVGGQSRAWHYRLPDAPDEDGALSLS